MELLVGADVGGTSSKVVVCGTDGEVRAFALAPGGNIRSSGASALDNVFAAVATALDASGGARVVGAHLGIAGAGSARHAEISAACVDRAGRLGIDPSLVTVGTDLETAFLASAPQDHGLLVVAGTGAVAAVLADSRVVGRCDGMGWLLGDAGSATWIGMRALGAVARSIDHRGPATSLVAPVLDVLAQRRSRTGDDGAVEEPGDVRQAMIAGAYELLPADFGALAPLVFGAAGAGDGVGRSIVEDAVDALARSAEGAVSDALAAGSPATGVAVLAGGLLSPGGPLRSAVAGTLARRLPEFPVVSDGHTAPPVVGAVRLAATRAHVVVDPDVLRESVSADTPFT